MLFNIQILLSYAPITNMQLLLDGIFIGAVLALSAYGLALVWGVMNVKNLAQGDFVIAGGYLAFAMFQWGVHPVIALPFVAATMFCFGWLAYIIAIRRVIQQDMFVSLLATFGLSILLQQVLNLIFGPEVKTIDSKLPNYQIFNEAVTLPVVKVMSLGMVCVLAIAMVSFMRYSRIGQAIRATAQDPRAARVLGVNTDTIYGFTFAINAAICGAAGVLVSIIWVLQPFYGITYSVRCFAIVTAAGLGNLPGVITTGLGLGVLEQYTGFVFGAEYQVASAVILLLAVLVWRQIQLSRTRQVVR